MHAPSAIWVIHRLSESTGLIVENFLKVEPDFHSKLQQLIGSLLYNISHSWNLFKTFLGTFFSTQLVEYNGFIIYHIIINGSVREWWLTHWPFFVFKLLFCLNICIFQMYSCFLKYLILLLLIVIII